MPTPHKHAALIKAWADGEIIQVKSQSAYGGYAWKDLDGPGGNCAPGWADTHEYRVKPSNVVRFIPVITLPAGAIVLGEGKVCKVSASDHYEGGAQRFERIRRVLRVEINPDTLELVSATMEEP